MSNVPARGHRVVIGVVTLLLALTVGAANAQPLITVNEAIEIVQQRYQGELLDVDMKSGRGWEQSEQVYEMRLLTEQGNVLKIRLAREDGRFLEIDGRGQVEARRPLSTNNG
ncbi:hypothetical protein LCGC14_0072890 [marine sediment metagenome]|uniref:PepSY domain-containing protein n=1 Tax=marine sediment metagenome TaxID=412755 RepID=A0A0F9YLX5_9ZZZZ|nr:hypothetical protein [Halomonas sp.]HDZ48942.1 Cys/Met metabolism pyridoxal-phosphate-dependent enzyme [Halomonas sp.]HEB06320.1 Cys/Met metabolism pyridoxal-phosphate-dependent enzyme [Halomonas sp.]